MTDTPEFKALASHDEQVRRGYIHTWREIWQQPETWLSTCELLIASEPVVRRSLDRIRALVLTGSGSSEYVGDCVRLGLQSDLGIVTEAIGSGTLLAFGREVLPPLHPGLLISIARSGSSPESVGTLALLLQAEPELRHLVLTCNADGALASTWRDNPRVSVIALDDRTNDRSLVMTSSFTNMVLALRFLGYLDAPDAYRQTCSLLARMGGDILRKSFAMLAKTAKRNFSRTVFLGDGARFGATREGALKMLEMTAGRVSTLSETYLGFRHGPMSFADAATLVVCFFSSHPARRPYQADLLRELDRKQLGLAKVIVGEDIPQDLIREGDVVVKCDGLAEVGDENAPVLDVMVAQILAFFRCLEEGLQPDSPSQSGIIQRVVEQFPLHYPAGIEPIEAERA